MQEKLSFRNQKILFPVHKTFVKCHQIWGKEWPERCNARYKQYWERIAEGALAELVREVNTVIVINN